MHRKLFLTAAFAVAANLLFAQTPVEKTRQYNHYIGVQANQLLKQLINLNNSNIPVNNPFIIVYTVSNIKSGWNAHAGIGYVYKKITDKNSPANHESKINDLDYRFGAGKTFMLGKRFEAACGLDFVGRYNLDKTFTTSVIDFGNTTDSSNTNVTSKTTSAGFGAQFNLSYHISEHILIGTESSYYFSDAVEKQNVLVTETIINNFTNTSTTTTTNTNLETETSSFIVRF
jgi:hypothetical protein